MILYREISLNGINLIFNTKYLIIFTLYVSLLDFDTNKSL